MPRQIEVDVFQIVGAGTADLDEFHESLMKKTG